MVRIGLFSILVCITSTHLGLGTVQRAEDKSRDAGSIEQAVDAWTAMWNSYDLSKVDELFVKDTTLTYFSSEKEGIIRGIDAVRKHHAGFGFVTGGYKQDSRLWLEDRQIDIFGNTAVVTAIWFFSRTVDGKETLQRGPTTFVYVRVGNEYRIAHVHFGNYE
jgi:ketosteroid isomerase-like protein